MEETAINQRTDEALDTLEIIELEERRNQAEIECACCCSCSCTSCSCVVTGKIEY
jgi:hypothetical protein